MYHLFLNVVCNSYEGVIFMSGFVCLQQFSVNITIERVLSALYFYRKLLLIFMKVFLSSQKETGQNVQSCCSNILSLWVLLLDSAVGRLVFCRGVIEAACCRMKNVKMQYVMGKKQHQGNWGALRHNNTGYSG